VINLLYAVKGNKQLKIDGADRQRYLNLGYDIAEVKGSKLEIVQHAPSKTVPYAQYEKLLQENEQLQAQLAAAGDTSELQAQLAEAEKKVKELEKKLKEAEKAAKTGNE
jgi:cell division septum initiation protein DivIVA